MDFRQFCEDEKVYLNFLREYKGIIDNSKKSNKNTFIVKKPNKEIKFNKGFFGDPNETVKNDFEKFDIHNHKESEPYIEKSGPFTYCDKCNRTTSPSYLSTPKYFKKYKPILKKEIPDHLMGKLPRHKSTDSSSSSESEDDNTKIQNTVLYKIVVKTNSDIKSGTNCPVFVRLVDKFKKSEPIELKKNFGSLKFFFAPNSIESFYVKSIPITELQNVNIKLLANKDSDEWFPEWIRVEEMIGEKRKWYCKIGRFLSSVKKDCKLVVQLKAIRVTVPIIKYQIKVKVSHESVDECYGLLSIKLSGSLSKSNVLKLENSKYPKIKCGTTPIFTIEHEELGTLKAIWVSISSSSNNSESEDDKKDKEKTKQNSRKMSQGSEFVKKKPHQRKGWEDIKIDSVIIEWIDSVNIPHSVEFICNQWIGLSDKMTQKSIILKNPIENKKANKSNQLKSESTEDETTYKIAFYTSKKSLSGTDATVFIKLYGTKGIWSKKYEFEDYNKKKFEAGNEDSFTVNGPNVGTVTKIHVGHNNKGFASGWKLDKINVIRHLTPTEICESLERMKKSSTLPKGIKLKNGELFIDKEVAQTEQFSLKRQTSSSSLQKHGLSSSSGSIDKINRNSPEKSSKIKKSFEGNTQVFALPYAENSTFVCHNWISKDIEKNLLDIILESEGSNFLFSPINLLLNPDN